MGQALTCTSPATGQLVSLKVNKGHILGTHKPFGDQGWGAQDQIISDPDCEISSIPIRIVLFPHPVSNIYHSLLQIL